VNNSRRKVGGYIWRDDFAQMRDAITRLRQALDALIEALGQRPVSVRVALLFAARMGVILNEFTQILRELEEIADVDRNEQS
jgi:hypothetical protein